jgi:predicted transcriptional regulator
MSTTQELVSVATAAKELGITPSAVRSAIAYGSLRAMPIDRRTNMIERAEVERYRREHLGQRGKRKKKTATHPEE